MNRKILAIIPTLAITFYLIWALVLVPELKNSDDILEITTENIGVVQFANDLESGLTEPETTIFDWDRKIVEKNGNVYKILTTYRSFDIKTNEILWELEIPEYVNQITREYADKDGHFIWPTNLEKTSYDVYDLGGSVLKYDFVGVEEIDGLEVYVYEGSTTFDISDEYPEFLPHAIYEDYYGIDYVEPVTGIAVSYFENFTDYAVIDGKRIPILVVDNWPNPFSQKVTVNQAKDILVLYSIYDYYIPISIGIVSGLVFLGVLSGSVIREKRQEIIKLREIDRKKDEFVSMASHEIKNPISPMKLACDLLLSPKYGKLNSEQEKKVKLIADNINEIDSLLQDISDIKKLDLSTMNFKFEKTNLRQLIQNEITRLRPQIDSQNISIILNVDESHTVNLDPSRFSQIIRNILKNSLNFIPKNNGKITISSEQSNERTLLTFEDNGIGIPKQDAELVFERFYQSTKPDNISNVGSGLGLSICQGIVSAHGGKIWVDTNYLDGTCIHIMLPNKQ